MTINDAPPLSVGPRPWRDLLGPQTELAVYADLSGVDAWAPNPLADMLRIQAPDRFAAVAADHLVPRMFSAGASDLPPFMSSGLDPQSLLRVPYGVRHALTAEADPAKVYDAAEAYAGQADALIVVPGLIDAAARLAAWLQTDVRTPAQIAQEDAEHEATMAAFGYVKQDNGRYGPRRMGRV